MPAEQENVLIAIYRNPQNLIESVKNIRKDHPKMEALTPFPLEELSELLPHRPSKVRWFTLIGALSGAGIAMIYQIMTVLEWPLNTGGKPIVSIPSFIPITFELLILFGAAATLLGLMLTAQLPPIRPEPYHSGSSTSEFALFIWYYPSDYPSLETRLYDAGASQVRPYMQDTASLGTD
jgi:hypothetical protein